MPLLILACSATKRADPAPLPALERYDGPAWRVLRRALAERPGLAARLDVLALSAEYGLISAAFPIPYYDRRMDRARAAALRPGVVEALGLHWPADYVEVGPHYRAALPPPPWPASVVVGHGAIGYRLHQLKAWLWTI